MGLPVREQITYWGIAAAVFLLVLWSMGNVILPFLVGAAIAYFLDPLADRLQRLGLNRVLATTLVALGVILIFVFALLLIVPTVVEQAIALINAAPEILSRLQAFLSERFPDVLDSESQLRQSLSGLGETIQSRGIELVETLLSSAMGVVSFVVFIVVAPVVAFYLLLDWDKMIARIDELLPRDHAPTIRRLAWEIDAALAGFVRGQLTVCGILAIYYSVALMLAGLQYGLVVGVTAGLISFIPYIGAIVGGALAIGLALFQFWGQPLMIGLVVGIFVVGQILEGNFLVPKLVGGSVGLHPVWLLFALSAFGSLFGFVGMLVAVPVAAAIGVLTRFATTQYANSRLYRGLDHPVGSDDRD